MQTFLPYPDFAASAAVLDAKRLGKQRVETIQVLRALTRETYGWKHHPVVKMWRGYEEALTRYGLDMCAIWTLSGRADTCAVTLVADLTAGTGVADVRSQHALASADELPPWLGDPAVHRSHRSALRRKDPAHYDVVFPDVPDDLPYVWPASDR
ncbi:MSMEG_6728 family protein [Actinoplanes sp. CA-030573]|uniref:MSMEG_6728 family protein n=1 Tax=Actinoplanes sp. CA-030573 TaxID=3239898 RepID=UPI003D935327